MNSVCSPLTLSNVLSLIFLCSALEWSISRLEVSSWLTCPSNLGSSDTLTRLAAVRWITVCLCVYVRVLNDVYKAAREQSRPAIPLQRAFEPAIFPLPVNKHNVALLKFQLCFALGRIWYNHPVPERE